MLSNTCKYAIRAVIYLGFYYKEDEKIGIKQISDDLGIPMPFLGKILQGLAKKKLISSSKGPHGGFGLYKDSLKLTLYDIVVAVDGADIFCNCLIGNHLCQNGSNSCPVHEQYHSIRSSFVVFFKSQSVGMIVSKMNNPNDFMRL
jgi:rrf2 family protein (putative transcriptional regulator)